MWIAFHYNITTDGGMVCVGGVDVPYQEDDEHSPVASLYWSAEIVRIYYA